MKTIKSFRTFLLAIFMALLSVGASAQMALSLKAGTNYNGNFTAGTAMQISTDFNAGPGDVINSSGVFYSLKLINTTDWVTITRQIDAYDAASAGLASGSSAVTINLPADLTPSASLVAPYKYFLFVTFTTESGANANAINCYAFPVILAAPAITVTNVTNNAIAFGNVNVGGTSQQTFNVSGVGLTGNVSLAKTLSQYTVSPTTLTPTNGTLASTQVTVTFAPTAEQLYSDAISFTGGGITPSSVSLSGTGIPAATYTVTFNKGTGTCSTASLTESVGNAGVVLPTATAPSVPSGWTFAGWTSANVSETTSAPTIYTAGSTYHPVANVTLYAVYTKTTSSGSGSATVTVDCTSAYAPGNTSSTLGAAYVQGGITFKANNIALGNMGSGYNPAFRLNKLTTTCRFWNTQAFAGTITSIAIKATIAPRLYVGDATLVGSTDSQASSAAITGFATPLTNPTPVSSVYTYDVTGVSGTKTHFALVGGTSNNLTDVKSIVITYSAVVNVVTYNSNPSLPLTTWNGTSWSTPPTTDYDAKISGNFSDVGFSCHHLTIDAGKNVTITSGTLTVSGNLTLKSDHTGTASLVNNGALTLSGIAYIERYMTKGGANGTGWHLVAPPVSGNGINTFITLNSNISDNGAGGYGIFDYNNSGGVSGIGAWNSPFTAATWGDLTLAKGYSVRLKSSGVDGAVTFMGTPVTGNQTVTVTDAGANWNCIGNPFTSAIAINSAAGSTNFISANSANLDDTYPGIYLWDETMSNTAYTPVVSNSPATYAQVAQAYFVKVKDGVTSLSMPAAMQQHQPTAAFKSAKLISPWYSMNVSVALDSKLGTTQLAFNEGMTTGADQGAEAGLFSSDPDFAIYSKLVSGDVGVKYSVQALPTSGYNTTIVPIGLESANAGSVTFSAKSLNLPSGMMPVFADLELYTFTDFSIENASYTTTIDANTSGSGRFAILTSPDVITRLKAQKASAFTVFASEKQLKIVGNIVPGSVVTVFDMAGRKALTAKISNDHSNIIDGGSLTKGLYFVKVEGFEPVYKVIVK